MEKLILNLTDETIEKYIKNTKKLIKLCDKNNLELELKYDSITNKELLNNMINIKTAINIKDKYKRYEFIYDIICNDLDKKINTNYCEFKNDICIRDRQKNNNHKNGCCECAGRGKCKYLIDSTCTLGNCMACKLFTCKALRKKGIVHNLNDYPLIKYFFTNKQKRILEFSYWTPREIVLDRLITNTYVRP